MTLGSLFTGIGGLDLGLERAGMRVRWQCEASDFRRRILERHWPDVARFTDVRDVGGVDLEPVDCIAAGFPCQDLSHAGRRAGLEGKRSGLWSEFRRIVGELQPRWAIVENVHHAWRSWVPSVRRDLGRFGYASVPLRMSAAEVGADHRRTRVFVVAHADSECLRLLARWWSGPRREVATEPLDPRWGTAASRDLRVDDGIPDGVERRSALGDAVSPQVAEQVGRAIMNAEERKMEG